MLQLVEAAVHAALPHLSAAASGITTFQQYGAPGSGNTGSTGTLPEQAAAALQAAVQTARSRLYIVRPAGGAQLLAVLLQLKRVMAQCQVRTGNDVLLLS